jgi:hypothetical protein
MTWVAIVVGYISVCLSCLLYYSFYFATYIYNRHSMHLEYRLWKHNQHHRFVNDLLEFVKMSLQSFQLCLRIEIILF